VVIRGAGENKALPADRRVLTAAPARSFATAVRAPGAPVRSGIGQGSDALAPTKEAADSGILNRRRAAGRFCETKSLRLTVLSECPSVRVPWGGGNSDTRTNPDGKRLQGVWPAPSVAKGPWLAEMPVGLAGRTPRLGVLCRYDRSDGLQRRCRFFRVWAA
jgi:hypothetical protein